MELRIEWITSEQRFDEIAAPWERLVADEPSPFSDHAWFGCWWRAFGADATLRICVVWDGDEIVAAAPLRARRSALSSLTNDHSPFFSLPATGPDPLRRCLDAVLADRPSWLALDIVTAGDPLVSALERAVAEHGRLLHVERGADAPFVDSSGDLEEWQRSRPRAIKDLPRRRRKLERDHRTEFRLESSAADLDRELDVGFAVEASGWKGQDGSAITSSPKTAAFYRALSHCYAQTGELRLGWLIVDDEPAAFNLCLQRGPRLYLLKTGYDESRRALAPGLVLNLLIVEHCFQSGLEAYELLGADDSWKLSFMTGAHERLRFWSASRGPVGLAHHVARGKGAPLLRRGRELVHRRAGTRGSM